MTEHEGIVRINGAKVGGYRITTTIALEDIEAFVEKQDKVGVEERTLYFIYSKSGQEYPLSEESYYKVMDAWQRQRMRVIGGGILASEPA